MEICLFKKQREIRDQKGCNENYRGRKERRVEVQRDWEDMIENEAEEHNNM